MVEEAAGPALLLVGWRNRPTREERRRPTREATPCKGGGWVP
jgi:hypothetical protein